MVLSFQGGWDYISIRANATRAPRSTSQQMAGEQAAPSGLLQVDSAPQEAMGPVCC